jgi:hypothetical protein
MSNDYNGWTNRATWLVSVWFNPESKDDVQAAREAIEDAEDSLPLYMQDFLCTREINWDELESHFEDEEDD